MSFNQVVSVQTKCAKAARPRRTWPHDRLRPPEDTTMKKHASAALALFAADAPIVATASAQTTPVPCKDMMSQVRDAEAGATLSEADLANVSDLEKQGIAACRA